MYVIHEVEFFLLMLGSESIGLYGDVVERNRR